VYSWRAAKRRDWALVFVQVQPLLTHTLCFSPSRIDHAHHDNLAKIAREEVVAFDRAVLKALKLTNAAETLVVVTADHSHAFTMNGYPKRGNPIGGKNPGMRQFGPGQATCLPSSGMDLKEFFFSGQGWET
jgi:alkaline phosphatase